MRFAVSSAGNGNGKTVPKVNNTKKFAVGFAGTMPIE